MTKIQVTNAHSKIPADVLELLRTLAYQCENFNNGDHSVSFVGVDEALDFIEQVESTVKGNKQERSGNTHE